MLLSDKTDLKTKNTTINKTTYFIGKSRILENTRGTFHQEDAIINAGMKLK